MIVVPGEVPVLAGGREELGAEGLAAAVEEVAEPFAFFVGHAAETEAADAVREDFEVAEAPVVFQRGGVKTDEVAAGRTGVGDAFVVVDEVAAAVKDQLAAVHFGRERVVGGVSVDEVGAAAFDELAGHAAVDGGNGSDPVFAPVERDDNEVALLAAGPDVRHGGGQGRHSRVGERADLELLKGRKIAALSGIALPVSFEESLIELGGDLVYTKRFVDHHRFSQQEILNVINRGKTRQADFIVTTQKDAVRFPKIDRRDLPIYFLRVEIKILKGAMNFQDCVRQICFR